MKTLHQISVRHKKVLTRVDFNVPLNKDGSIADDTRMRAHIETIEQLLHFDAKIILMAHLGDESKSLKPVAEHLSKLIGKPVAFCGDCIGETAKKAVDALKDADILLLENVRSHAGENLNDRDFAKALSELGDVYVNDAFATAHREHASVCAITDFFDIRAAGVLMGREIAALTHIKEDAKKPFSVIIGGAKISTKLGLLREIVRQANQLFIGGAMANTFLKAQAHKVGTSLTENDMLGDALDVLNLAKEHNCVVHLPKDCMVAENLEATDHHVCLIENMPEDKMILDIGPMTTQDWFRALDGSATILWNGPVGAFETAPYHTGTTAIAHELASLETAHRVVGGGDTIAATVKAGVTERFNLVSTGGGAMLRFLEGEPLPAIEALRDSNHQ